MRHSRPRPPVVALALGALILISLTASGCGVWPRATSTHVPARALGTPGPTARGVRVYSASIQVPEDKSGVRVSVSCPAGAQMIGGGYGATDTFEYDAFVDASYPSSAYTWTVVSGSSAAFYLEADIYCLTAKFPLDVQIVQMSEAAASGDGCPTGSIQLGEGFNHPSDFSSSGLFYYLCASQHVSAGTVVTTRYNPHSSIHSYYPGSVTLACPSSQIAISGDTDGGDIVLANQSAGAPYTSWSFTAGGDGDLALTVRCVSFIP